MTGRVIVLRPRQLAPSVLREALAAGRSGADPAGLALIGLLDVAGLLDDQAFVEACVTLDVDGDLLYADLDLQQLLAVSVGEDPLPLAPLAHQLLSAGLGLVDLASCLRGLDPDLRGAAVAVLCTFLHSVGPAVGLTVSMSPADTATATSPVPAAAGGTR